MNYPDPQPEQMIRTGQGAQTSLMAGAHDLVPAAQLEAVVRPLTALELAYCEYKCGLHIGTAAVAVAWQKGFEGSKILLCADCVSKYPTAASGS